MNATNSPTTFLDLTRAFSNDLKSALQTTDFRETGFEPGFLSPAVQQQLNDYSRLLGLSVFETALFLICVNCSLFTDEFQLPGQVTSTTESAPGYVNVQQLIDLAGGNKQTKRDYILGCFQHSQALIANKFLNLYTIDPSGPFVYARLVPTNLSLDKFVFANKTKPAFGPDFPVKNISTLQEWSNLVVSTATQKSLDEILDWITYRKTVFNDRVLSKSVKRGYRVLFHGASGTGKSLTAALLGKKAGMEVYCIDLSLVVSKYIGETEKNLETVFKTLEQEDCILFFDEADALFGKRTSVTNAHDRYANQEVSYLLQRLEDFNGLTILASNFKGNIDQAFNRRFNNMIHFAVPGREERLKLWAMNEPDSLRYRPGLDLKLFADKYELTGSNIVNSIHYAFLRSLSLKKQAIEHDDIFEGIKKEFTKMERTIPA